MYVINWIFLHVAQVLAKWKRCVQMPYVFTRYVVAGGIAGCQNDSLRCRGWRQGGIVAALCLPVPKLSPGNTLHVLSQNIWQYNTTFRWSMWSYSSIIIDDGGSSIWRLGCRWWHPGLSLWQLMLPPVAAGLTGWRTSIFGDGIGSRYITMYMCVSLCWQMYSIKIYRINAFWIWIWYHGQRVYCRLYW